MVHFLFFAVSQSKGNPSSAFSPYVINRVQISNHEKFLIVSIKHADLDTGSWPLTPTDTWSDLTSACSVQLNEVDVETEFLKASDASCDVACLMYDTSDPHSFDYCASIYKVSCTIWRVLYWKDDVTITVFMLICVHSLVEYNFNNRIKLYMVYILLARLFFPNFLVFFYSLK